MTTFTASSYLSDLSIRPRRNRKSAAIRSLVEETVLRAQDLVASFFVIPGEQRRISTPSLLGIDYLSSDLLLKEVEILHRQGIMGVLLFPFVSKEQKDSTASHALHPDNALFYAIQLLKKEIPSLCVMVDVALDPFTDHGHDGVIDEKGMVLNDETVFILTQLSLLYAQAGVDVVAPSEMMDGRVKAIRQHLDRHGFSQLSILSYAAKYASSLYAPFRQVLDSAVKIGDKKGYLMNPANVREAVWEAHLDEVEGADILMVKPASLYLDVIAKVKENTSLPIAAYHVSGEYAMVMAAHEKGLLDAGQIFLETLLSIKRAGADLICTYAAPHVLPLL